MLTRLVAGLLVVLSAVTAAAEPPAAPAETIRLWTGTAPGALGTADHDVPVVAWWPAAGDAARAAVVICPGGGYRGLADHEGSDYARWLNSLGISAAVLRYRLGTHGYRHPVMLGDVSRAMRLVRHEHERLGVDPARVGVIGSSAGGHLAMTLLIHGDDGDAAAADPIDRRPSRADLGVLCYPVVSMTADKSHGGSRASLLGEKPPEDLVRDLSGELVAAERLARVPPVFIWHTWEDQSVKLGPILEFAARLRAENRPFALHVYEIGRHGIGLGVRPYDAAKLHPWSAECGRWLGAHGFTNPTTAATDPH